MRWSGRRESDNVEDQRGRGLPVGGMTVGGGLGTLVLIILVMLFRGDPGVILNQQPGGGGGLPPIGNGNGDGGGDPSEVAANDESKQFISVVLADTEDVWNDLFRKEFGKPYREPKLVLFSGQVQSGCGFTGAAVGPFYCPADQKVYLDLSFFDELRDRFRAPGDFAAAYVVAHEVGHHVQNLLGISDKMQEARGNMSKEEYNRLSVRLELQADYLAGVWAHHAQESKKILESGDLEEALRAATAIGDDRLQKQAQGYVVPESFTHGTSSQRVKWFRRGFESGDVGAMEQLFELPYNQL